MRDRIEVVVGDLTRLRVDAIVNAANESLLGGGGVDGAIHRAAGPRLLEYNRGLGGCATGEAKAAPAFDLERSGISHVIHTVGPVWRGRADEGALDSRPEDELLRRCYRSALAVASELGARTVAFPSIGTGAYGFPRRRAARLSLDEVARVLPAQPLPERVTFCCFDPESAELYRGLLATLA